MLRLTVISLLSLGISSCTALQDVDQFEADFSCGVDIGLRRYFPHAQEPDDPMFDNSRSFELRERFGVYVVQERRPAGGEFQRFYVARAFFDPLPAPNVDIRMPFAVEASETGDELPATLELHADRQTVEQAIRNDLDLDFFEISEIPTDHSWILPHACSVANTEFTHNSDFDQLQPAAEQALGLKVRPAVPASDDPPMELLREFQTRAQNSVETTIEIRVVREAIVDSEEVEQARAFYRRGASDRTIRFAEDGELRPLADIIEDIEIDMGGVLREDEDVSVIAFVDTNGNGLFDAGEFATEVELDLASTALRPCIGVGRPPGNFAACSDGDDVIVEFSVGRDNNPNLIREAWWTYIPPDQEE